MYVEPVYSHHRINKKDYPEIGFLPSHLTLALETDELFHHVSITFAACSHDDQFSREEGRRICNTKMNVSKDDYLNNMEKYRLGNTNKPIGFREDFVVEDLSRDNWKDVQATLIDQYIPVFLNFYNDQKLLHLERLERSEAYKKASQGIATTA